MPDVLLFGATGYTGKLTAHALGRRGHSFVIAGRNPAKLESLAAASGAEDVRVVEVGDIDGLAQSLDDVKAMITCVGPFMELGETAVEAALRAGVHYIDSTGEIAFIKKLIATADERARDAGIAMVPAAGFDEVPADTALSMAVDGMTRASAVLTYAFPSQASQGTLRTILTEVGRSDAAWIVNDEPVAVRTGSRTRWAPMPPPLGPKYSVSLPLSEGALAPLHLDLESLEIYGTTNKAMATLMQAGMPLARAFLGLPFIPSVVDAVLRTGRGPDEAARQRGLWTILAEARFSDGWRNVALMGKDPYGLTAETLVAIATQLAREPKGASGVMSPVQAVGVDVLQKELIDFGVDFRTWEGA